MSLCGLVRQFLLMASLEGLLSLSAQHTIVVLDKANNNIYNKQDFSFSKNVNQWESRSIREDLWNIQRALLSKSPSLWFLADPRCSPDELLSPAWVWLALATLLPCSPRKECWFLLISAKWCVCKERLSGLVSVIWTTIDGFSVLSPSFSSNLLLNIRQERSVRDLFLCRG